MENASLEHSEELRTKALGCLQAFKDESLDERARDEQMRDAWKYLEESIQICPTNNRARFLIVSCAMAEDDFVRAKEEGTAIFKSLTIEQRCQVGDAALHLSLAHVSKMLGDIDDAIMYAGEAAKLFPEDPHPHMILGELYEVYGSPNDAERECREALRYQSDLSCKHGLKDQSVYFMLCCLASALSKQRKYSEAERFLAQAVNLDNSSTLALRYLVDVYHNQGLLRDALELARKLEEHDPDDEYIRDKIEEMLHDEHKGSGSESSWLGPMSKDGRDRRYEGREPRRGSADGSVKSGPSRGSRRSASSHRGRDREHGYDRRRDGSQHSEVDVPAGSRTQEKGSFDLMCCCFDRGPEDKPTKRGAEDRPQSTRR